MSTTPKVQTTIHRTADFELTGSGDTGEWERAQRLPLVPLQRENAWITSARILYSDTGMYFLVECEDTRISCTITEDHADLFTEDVIEVFLQPCEAHPVYLEYEISPLGFELPLVVCNDGTSFHGWLPWKNFGRRAVKRATQVMNGSRIPGSECTGWSVEFFIPFKLMSGLSNVPPKSGAKWRANLCRIDYDLSSPRHWAWSAAVGTDFHDYSNFGILQFGDEVPHGGLSQVL